MTTRRFFDRPLGTRSIRVRLLLSFGVLIVTSSLLFASFLALQLRLTRQYEEVTNRLLLENQFTLLIPELIDSYFNVLNSGQVAADRLAAYDQKRQDIETTVAGLDRTISDPGSQAPYRSLKNFVQNIVKECDRGLALMAQGNYIEARDAYGQNIVFMKPFVVEDTGTLMVSELTVAERLQNQVQTTHRLITWLSLILLLLVTAIDVLFMFTSSARLMTPLSQLTDLARTIAGGNLEVGVARPLLDRPDEIGSLAHSFDEMLRKLRQELAAQQAANASLSESSQKLAEKNSELERINRYMIDRELKMVELKQRIAELEKPAG